MHLQVYVNNVPLVALVDTGSAATIIPFRVYESLKLKERYFPSHTVLTAFGQNRVHVVGECRANIKICGSQLVTNILIVSDSDALSEMLIGQNVLAQGNLQINYKGRVLFELVSASVIQNTTQNTTPKTHIEFDRVYEDTQQPSRVIENNKNVVVQNECTENSSVNNGAYEGISDRDCEMSPTADKQNPLFLMSIEEMNMDNKQIDLSHIKVKTIRDQIVKMICEYKPEKPTSSAVQMQITLVDNIPVHRPPRRLAPQERAAVSDQIDEWIRDGIVRPSRSNYASPVVVVKKKDNSNRLCVDFRELNRKVVKDRYPLPVIEDVLSNFHSSRVFSTLDLKNGFFHVDIHPESITYTSFVTPDGQYEFLKAPFGLCNSPAVFQRYVNTTLNELIREKCVHVYMDDLIIASETEEENIQSLQKVLKVTADAGMIIRFEKCQFVKRNVLFLGHILENGCVRPSDEKTAAIKNYPQPQTLKQVKAFLGLASYFRKFVPNFALIARPLSELTKDNVPFIFGEAQKTSFSTLKDILCTEPILKVFDPSCESELHTDASKNGYGACLMQLHDGKWFPVFYLSKRTTSSEQNYSSYELEILAIIYALRKLRVYLLGLEFRIITDCNAFNLTMRKRDINPRVARWALQLEEFNCIVVHRSGSAMRHVDALSRYPSVYAMQDDLLETIKNCQMNDPECSVIRACIEAKGTYKDYDVRREILYRVIEGTHLLVVPKPMQKQLIRTTHNRGHLSAGRVEAEIRKDYSIPKLSEKCARVVAQCVTCILSSRKSGKQEGLYNPIEKGNVPLDTYHIDHLGPLPSTAKNYKYIMVIIDAFTKYVWLYPVRDTSSANVLKRLEFQQECFGSPRRIVTDRGTAFTSLDFRAYCEKERIDHELITTGVPRGNGQVERVNGIIIPALTKLSILDPLKWFQHTKYLQRFLNSTITRSTKKSPFELMFGVAMRNPEDLPLASAVEEAIQEQFEEDRLETRLSAKEAIDRIQEENRRTFNRNRKPAKKYAVGDLVAIQRTQFVTGGKLLAPFMGPYRVTAVKRNDRYQVERVKSSGVGPSRTSTSADLMKPWQSADADDLSDDDDGCDSVD